MDPSAMIPGDAHEILCSFKTDSYACISLNSTTLEFRVGVFENIQVFKFSLQSDS